MDTLDLLLEFLDWALRIAAVAAVVFLLLLRPRRGHGAWDTLRRYRYAHRGLHQKPDIPENSLPAFRRAAKQGYGAELDVHLTRDGRLAVIHDSGLRRTCGAEGKVEDFTAEELSRFRLEGTAEPIPFLEEVVPLFEGKAPLIVELKTDGHNYRALAAATVECLDGFGTHYALESFDPRCLLWLRRNRPELCRGQLAENFIKRPGGLHLLNRFLLTNLLYNGSTRPDFIAYHFEDRTVLANRLCCRLWGAQGVSWTIRCRGDMEQAEREGNLVIFETFDPKGETE